VWFTPRDSENRSHLAWLEIDVSRPQYVQKLSEDPTLAPGPKGRFDDAGTMGSWLTDTGEEQRQYYIGWTKAGTDPYHVSIGLAVGHDKGTAYSRHAPNAVFDRNDCDPIFVSTPCVLKTGDAWHMWYLSATEWPKDAKSPDHTVRHATSSDGISWIPNQAPCIEFSHPGECAISRPSVIIDENCWRMWFCYRGKDAAYRIGYAESPDGESWTRQDDRAGLTTEKEGWDSEMVAYPHVFDHDGQRYMVYSGNGYGKGGMGLAVLEQD
jgi:hypothetical protein